MKLNSFSKNAISLFIQQGFTYILPLLSFPYLYRVLGNYNFGILNFLFAFTQYFIVFADFGFNLSATREIALNRSNKEIINDCFSKVLYAKLVLVSISAILYFIFIQFFTEYPSNKLVFWGGFLVILGNCFIPTWLLQGLEKLSTLTSFNVIFRILNVVFIFTFIKTDKDLPYVILLNGLSSILLTIASYIYIFVFLGLKIKRSSFRSIYGSIKESAFFFLSRVSVILYTTTNSFILGLVAGPIAVTQYSSAEKLYTSIQTIYTPVNTALYPYMSQKKDISFFRKIFKYTLLANVAIVATCALAARFIFSVLFKNYSEESIHIFYIFLVICLITVPSIMIGYPFLGALGHGKYVNQTVVISSLFHATSLSLLYFTGQLNAISISCTIIITELIVLILRLRKLTTIHKL